jgi:hypothetical protein
MTEETQSNNQQMIVYALIAIAVLLAVIVGFMIYQKTTAVPGPTAGAATQQTAADAGAAAGQQQMPPGAASGAAAEPFDAKTATKIPSGMTPEQALKSYNELIIAGKFADAYKLLPKDKQVSYGSPEAYAAQVKAYGITSFKTGKPTTQGNDVVIVSEQVTPQMPITYTWTFTKDGSTWIVKSRTMGGTVQ